MLDLLISAVLEQLRPAEITLSNNQDSLELPTTTSYIENL